MPHVGHDWNDMHGTPEWTKELCGAAPGSKGENGSRDWRSDLPITPTCMGAKFSASLLSQTSRFWVLILTSKKCWKGAQNLLF